MVNFINNFLNLKIYRLKLDSIFIKFTTSPVKFLLFENNQNLFFFYDFSLKFFRNKLIWNFFRYYLKKKIENFSIYNSFFKFK